MQTKNDWRGTVRAFLHSEPSASLILLVATAAALVAANSPAANAYFELRRFVVTVGAGPLALSKPLEFWVNEGLMALFFFVLGLEIKREVMGGELASPRRAALPVIAAAAGMIVPAVIYSLFNAGTPAGRGWGIPTATDIAFALGVASLLGRRVPAALKVFLTVIAVADDIGAVMLIAAVYTGALTLTALGVATMLFAALVAVGGARLPWVAVYTLLGAALWVAVLESGVHATVAGVLVAMTVPAQSLRPEWRAPLPRFEVALRPWVHYGVMPIFALVNAGVTLPTEAAGAVADPVTLGVLVGLVVGKAVGVTGSCWLSVRLRLAALPSGATWWQLYGIASLCGIGFTMSLFIATLALADPAALDRAKIGILLASFLAGIHGYVVLTLASPGRYRRPRAT